MVLYYYSIETVRLQNFLKRENGWVSGSRAVFSWNSHTDLGSGLSVKARAEVISCLFWQHEFIK
jgi:hypothetical protein